MSEKKASHRQKLNSIINFPNHDIPIFETPVTKTEGDFVLFCGFPAVIQQKISCCGKSEKNLLRI